MLGNGFKISGYVKNAGIKRVLNLAVLGVKDIEGVLAYVQLAQWTKPYTSEGSMTKNDAKTVI
jgi:hypothetical protein